MSHRKLGAGRGAGWVTDGIAVFSGRPGPFLGVCFALGLLSSLPVISLLFGLLGVFFYAGLVSALHTQAQGGTPGMGQVFDAFGKPGAFARLLPIAALNIGLALVAVAALFAIMGPLIMQIIEQGENAKPDQEMILAMLPSLGLALLVLVPLGILVGWITLFAVPRAMLDEVNGISAMGEALAAILGNFGAVVVNLLCLVAIMVVLTLLLMIPMMVIALVSASNQGLATLLQIPVMAVFSTVVFALYGGIMYQAWREVFAGEVTTDASQLEV